MTRPGWVLPAIAGGTLAACSILLGPALGAPGGEAALLPAILPLGFFGSGLLGSVLLPGHAVGHRLLATGTFHLGAFALALLATTLPHGVDWSVTVLASVAYWSGFVLLFDALARYPDGRYGIAAADRLALVGATWAIGFSIVAALGSSAGPDLVEGLPRPANPLWVPALEPLSGLVSLTPLLLVVGLVLMVIRYLRSGADERSPLRWPLGAVVAVVVGVLSTSLLQGALGVGGQAAIFIVIGATLPASFLIGLLQRAREEDRIVALEASRSRIAAAAVQERRRIERDLHDGAQQQLLALMAQVALAREEAPPDSSLDRELGRIAAAIAEVHRELRELARGIYPAVLTDRGLVEAVASAADRLPVRASLDAPPEVRARRFPPPIEGAAYLFVLESLANVLKHAEARSVSVRVANADGRLEVTVADDGRGFVLDSLGPGALQGMRDRLAAVDGRLEVQSRPGAGTTVRGLFPFG